MFYRYLPLVVFLLAPISLLEAQTEEAICDGIRAAFYKTDLEWEQDPCASECVYDTDKQKISVTCDYDYCRECDAALGFCGYRSVQMEWTLSSSDLLAFVATNGTLTLPETKQWCIRYEEGELDGRERCIDVDDSVNCGSLFRGPLEFGLPLLSCDTTAGCRCAIEDSGIAANDGFVGFEKLAFDTCYNSTLTALTELPPGSGGAFLQTTTVLLSAFVSFLMQQ